MDEVNLKTLERLEGTVASVRTALTEMSFWHQQALTALDDLQEQLENDKAELRKQAAARRAAEAKEAAEAAEAAAAAAATAAAARGVAASGSKRRAATRAAAGAAAKEPAEKRAKAATPDAVARKALLKAVEKGQLADVKRFLAVVDPNFYGDEGNTPLHLAAKLCRQPILQVLLEKGADVRTTNHSQQTALHAAALSDTKGSCCELLLRAIQVADAETMDVQDKTQRTALHYAAVKGNARAVELLLEFGADVSIKNIKGSTALDVASTPQVRRLLTQNSKFRRIFTRGEQE